MPAAISLAPYPKMPLSNISTTRINDEESKFCKSLVEIMAHDFSVLAGLNNRLNASPSNYDKQSHIGKQKFVKEESTTLPDSVHAALLCFRNESYSAFSSAVKNGEVTNENFSPEEQLHLSPFFGADQFKAVCRASLELLTKTPVVVHMTDQVIEDYSNVRIDNQGALHIVFPDDLLGYSEDDVLGVAIETMQAIPHECLNMINVSADAKQWYQNAVDLFDFVSSDALNSNPTDKAHVLAAALIRGHNASPTSNRPTSYVTNKKIDTMLSSLPGKHHFVPLPSSPERKSPPIIESNLNDDTVMMLDANNQISPVTPNITMKIQERFQETPADHPPVKATHDSNTRSASVILGNEIISQCEAQIHKLPITPPYSPQAVDDTEIIFDPEVEVIEIDLTDTAIGSNPYQAESIYTNSIIRECEAQIFALPITPPLISTDDIDVVFIDSEENVATERKQVFPHHGRFFSLDNPIIQECEAQIRKLPITPPLSQEADPDVVLFADETEDNSELESFMIKV